MSWKSPAFPRSKMALMWWSVSIGAALVLLQMVLVGFELEIRALSPGCFFRKLTGLNCPGCGGTRAFFAFLRGDLVTSLRMNPLFLAASGLGLFFLSLSVMDRTVRGRPGFLNEIRLTATGGWAIGGALVTFWILRNIPAWPFTLLSPP
ncbi:MAG: DUF2752 domain-containing protein [Luteolibacter sp.]